MNQPGADDGGLWVRWRLQLAGAAGGTAFLATWAASCDPEGNASGWAQCRSWLGNPIVDWPGGGLGVIIPALIGVAVGLGVWRLLNPRRGD